MMLILAGLIQVILPMAHANSGDGQRQAKLAQCAQEINDCNAKVQDGCTKYCATLGTPNCFAQCETDFTYITEVTSSCESIVDGRDTRSLYCKLPPVGETPNGIARIPGENQPSKIQDRLPSEQCHMALNNANSVCGKQPSVSSASDNSGGVNGACDQMRASQEQISNEWLAIANSCTSALSTCNSECAGSSAAASCAALNSKVDNAKKQQLAATQSGGDAGTGCQSAASMRDANSGGNNNGGNGNSNNNANANNNNNKNQNQNPFNMPTNTASAQQPQQLSPIQPPSNGMLPGAAGATAPTVQKDSNVGASMSSNLNAQATTPQSGMAVGAIGNRLQPQGPVFPSLNNNSNSAAQAQQQAMMGGMMGGMMPPPSPGGGMGSQPAPSAPPIRTAVFNGAPRVSTDVLKGMRSGGYSSSGFSGDQKTRDPASNGGGYYMGGFAGSGGGSMGRYRGMDLKQYLPGGRWDPSRRISGVNFAHPDIRPMGDSIWQSVSNRFMIHCRLQDLYDCR